MASIVIVRVTLDQFWCRPLESKIISEELVVL